ncbi:phosphoribosylglycinamide synthetase C domain-containing protein, partial [Escherichia coli]|uniref:phosphoribosylglycinamide synthetase C domain-containing protein n=1 Tax=Escherichia coli TaxID=562 RepID=UPI003D2F5178
STRPPLVTTCSSSASFVPAWNTLPSATSSSGGRVLCVTALGHTVAEAQKRAYALMTDIHWDDCF